MVLCDLAVSGDSFSQMQERFTQRLDDCGSTVYLTTGSWRTVFGRRSGRRA